MALLVPQIKVEDLLRVFPRYIGRAPEGSPDDLVSWNIECDKPIFQFLYGAHKPKRHLEFGTWEGWGSAVCLEACDATVWTINLPDGESKSDGSWAYGQRVLDTTNSPMNITTMNFGSDELGPRCYHRTDAGDYIGRIYREKGLGHRVCQIYCDSRKWDNSNFSYDFFDSVLIDGGHQPEVVMNDTRKALEVLRSGGLIMWHDFCPLEEVRTQSESVKGVTEGLEQILPKMLDSFEWIFWINPSWILVGKKK